MNLCFYRMHTSEIQFASSHLEMADDDELADTGYSTKLQKQIGELILTKIEDEHFSVRVCDTSSAFDNCDAGLNKPLTNLNSLCKGESKEKSNEHLANLDCSTVKPFINNKKITYAEVLARTKNAITFHAHDRPQAANSTFFEFITESAKIRKQIVQQRSTPNLNGNEFERISKDSEYKLSDHNIDQSDRRSMLPRAVKLYQLLATQSEDSGEFYLADRRTSFQISEYEDKICSVSKQHEQKLAHAESVPNLKVTDFADSGLRYFPLTVRSISPFRKFSFPEENVGAQQNFSNIESITVRPIYPHYPYSPNGSPLGSPTTRRRPLRESRRISIDNRHGALQINQYKQLDNIGQVREVYNNTPVKRSKLF